MRAFCPKGKLEFKDLSRLFLCIYALGALSDLLFHRSVIFLQFYFASQRESSYGPEYLLVTEYHSKGSLMQFLKSGTVTWQEMCSLSHSLAAGLAYLHNDGKLLRDFMS